MTTPPEFRPALNDSDAEVFASLIVDAFAIPEQDARGWPAQLGLENVRLFGRGQQADACLAYYRMGHWFGGRRVSSVGVAGVAVQPPLRGRGVASQLMQAALLELAESNVALSGLYPASMALYSRAGYSSAGGRYEVRVPADRLPRAARNADMQRLESAADPRMRACYDRAAAQRNGWLSRSEPLWARVREQRGITREGWAWIRDGECAAYVWFSRVPRPLPQSDIVCSDLVATDRESALALFAFLASYSTVCKELVFYSAPGDPLLEVFEEFSWRLSHLHPWMLRIVDAALAISERGFQPALRGRVSLEIADDLLPRNRGKFTLIVEDGRGRLERGGSSAVSLDIRGFASLFSGQQSAEALSFNGSCRGSAEDLATLTALFAGSPPATPEMY